MILKRFRFRLETVLRHREALETQAEQNYQRAQVMVEEANVKIRAQETRRREAMQIDPDEITDTARLQNRERFLLTVQAAIALLEREREAAGIVADMMKTELVAARQAREALSKLREKDVAEHTFLILREEQNALDEMATMRHGRV